MHPVLLRLGGNTVASYGVLVALGYLTGCYFLWRNRERMGMSFWQFWVLMYCIVGGAVLGAKAGFFLVERELFLQDPWWLLTHWRTGWVFWSGFLGTLVAAKVYQEGFNAFGTPKKRYLPPADYFGAALPLGHAIGRVGCFAQGCCHGRPTTVPWGVSVTEPGSSIHASLLGLPLHPVQLYEAAGNLAISAAVAFWVLPRIEAGRWRYGTAFFVYIACYSALRLLTEPFRGDDRGFFLSGSLSPSQWWSLGGLALASTMLWLNGVRETPPGPRGPESPLGEQAGRSVYF